MRPPGPASCKGLPALSFARSVVHASVQKGNRGSGAKIVWIANFKVHPLLLSRKVFIGWATQKYRFYAGVKRNTIKMILLNNYILKY